MGFASCSSVSVDSSNTGDGDRGGLTGFLSFAGFGVGGATMPFSGPNVSGCSVLLRTACWSSVPPARLRFVYFRLPLGCLELSSFFGPLLSLSTFPFSSFGVRVFPFACALACFVSSACSLLDLIPSFGGRPGPLRFIGTGGETSTLLFPFPRVRDIWGPSSSSCSISRPSS